jgi:polyisoprenoid-binding protein YceI
MKLVLRACLAAFAAAAFVAAPAALAQTQWKMDPSHSHASFTVRHLVISNVRGEFGKMEGTLSFDPDAPEKSRIEATIDTTSIDTREPKRDAHLKSPDFFDTAKFPTMTFKSTKVERAGDGYEVTGDLTIKGTTKPVVFKVDEVTKPIKDMQGSERVGVHATTKINRQEFGLTWNKAVEAGPVVGDDVNIEIAAEYVKAGDAPAAQAKAEMDATKKPKETGTPKMQAGGGKPAGQKSGEKK